MKKIKIILVVIIVFYTHIVFAQNAGQTSAQSTSTAQSENQTEQNTQSNANTPTPQTNQTQNVGPNKEKAKKLVEQAKVLISKEKYYDAQQLLIQAMKLDPDNEQTKDMLVNVTEILEQTDVGRSSKPPKKYIGLDFGFDFSFMYSKSDFQSSFASNTWTSGISAFVEYFLRISAIKNTLGFRISYDGVFLRLKSDGPKIMLNIINIEAIFKYKFGKNKNGLALGGYIGYRIFSLKNKSKYLIPSIGLTRGLYDVTGLYAPYIGVFVKDTLLYYIKKSDFTKRFIFLLYLDYLPYFKSGKPSMFKIMGGFSFELMDDFYLNLTITQLFVKNSSTLEKHLIFKLGASFKF